MSKARQGVWHKGNYVIYQDLSLEEQEDFWKDIDSKLGWYKKKQEDKLKNEIVT